MSQAPSFDESAIEVVSTSDDDSDSVYGTDVESDTTSLSAAVLAYQYENGRRYTAFR